jgi:5-methylcytosine-specific restriction endonuclease McrA
MCAAHSVRVRTGISLDKPIRPRRRNDEPDAVCVVDGCGKLAKGAFGWCKSHWATQTGKGTEYSARRRSRKFDGPHDRITAADLAALLAATDDCYLCNKPLADPIEFDHVIPLARGGRHLLVNIKPTHRHCNRVKWAALPPEVVAARPGEEVML